MKKTLICGMMLGLLTSVSFAQRAHTVRPTATVPHTVGMAPVAPMAATTPNAVSSAPAKVAPDSVTGSTHAKTVTPNATLPASTANTATPSAASTSPTARTVNPNANTVPDRTMLPDAQGVSDHASNSPNQ